MLSVNKPKSCRRYTLREAHNNVLNITVVEYIITKLPLNNHFGFTYGDFGTLLKCSSLVWKDYDVRLKELWGGKWNFLWSSMRNEKRPKNGISSLARFLFIGP